ncbi:MAG: hypothetical protein ACR2OY_11345 [Boseongicola sp.]
MIKNSWKYAIDHWRGQHGLAWSFWINLVLIRVVIFAAQELLSPDEGHDFSDSRAIILALALVFHGLVLVWQVVGVVRAAGIHIRASGSMAPVWASQLGIIAAFLWAISYVFGAWQMTVPIPDLLTSQIEFEAERAAKYSIEPTKDGQSLMLAGSLELGITDHLRAQIESYPGVDQIILASTGGNIYEARGLANVIRQNALDTLVVDECSSACTTVFIGGANRHLAPGGKLGFHQYRIDADYAVLNADPLREQSRDRAAFSQSGVALWFLDKMFDSEASEMWYPEQSELIDANVVTDN